MATNVLPFPRRAANDNRPLNPPPAVLALSPVRRAA